MTITATGTAEALDVAGDLRALGLPRNGIYLVHSSLRRVGPLAEGPRTLVDGLRETCGPRSTIVAPTFTAGNSTTTRAYRRRTEHMGPEQCRAEEDRIAGFDLPVAERRRDPGVHQNGVRVHAEQPSADVVQRNRTARGGAPRRSRARVPPR